MDIHATITIRESLEAAEQGMLKVINQAAAVGDYSLCQSASGLAEEIRRIRDSLPDLEVAESTPASTTPPATQAARPVPKKQAASNGQISKSRKRVVKRSSKKRKGRTSRRSVVAPPGEYPRFEIRRDTLFRVGWSKKAGEEYTHKAPREAFDGTVRAFVDLVNGSDGSGPYPAEDVIELLEQSRESNYPSYQVYVIIGFLKHEGCLEQQGREGYAVPHDFEDRAESAWTKYMSKKVG